MTMWKGKKHTNTSEESRERAIVTLESQKTRSDEKSRGPRLLEKWPNNNLNTQYFRIGDLSLMYAKE
jgi:hypothetical protein